MALGILKKADIVAAEYLRSTTMGLDGLFLKIAEVEKKIRTDSAARVTVLLKRVFGAEV